MTTPGECQQSQHAFSLAYICMYLCHRWDICVHPADFEEARLHRRIQSAEHIARLAESKVTTHDDSACSHA